MDTHFGQSITYGAAIAGIALPEPVHPAIYLGFSDRILQGFHVLPENIRLLYLFHGFSVIYSLLIVKQKAFMYMNLYKYTIIKRQLRTEFVIIVLLYPVKKLYTILILILKEINKKIKNPVFVSFFKPF
jgi:hypothetical protein